MHEGLLYEFPHWLYDVGMSFVYDMGGFNAIYISTCVFTILLGISIYLVGFKINKNRLLSFIVTVAVLYLIKGYVTARAQLVTFILFIWLVYNIEKFIENKKMLNVVVLFFIHLLIANLHVAVWPFTFVLYLPYIAEYLIAELSDIVLYKKVESWYLNQKGKNLNKKIESIKSKDDKEKYSKKLQQITEKLQNKQIKAQKIKKIRKEEKGKKNKIKINKKKKKKKIIIIKIK